MITLGPPVITQEHLPISGSLLPHKVTYSQVPGGLGCGHLWGPLFCPLQPVTLDLQADSPGVLYAPSLCQVGAERPGAERAWLYFQSIPACGKVLWPLHLSITASALWPHPSPPPGDLEPAVWILKSLPLISPVQQTSWWRWWDLGTHLKDERRRCWHLATWAGLGWVVGGPEISRHMFSTFWVLGTIPNICIY